MVRRVSGTGPREVPAVGPGPPAKAPGSPRACARHAPGARTRAPSRAEVAAAGRLAGRERMDRGRGRGCRQMRSSTWNEWILRHRLQISTGGRKSLQYMRIKNPVGALSGE
eukprot:scaffold1297_cov368-Prasinococcus_capsulatus_cf.AAC.1